MQYSLLPWRTRELASRSNGDPFTSLQREMNRIFNHLGQGFDLAPFDEASIAKWSPRVNVTETDKEFTVSAELPGLEQKDVEVAIQNGALAIKGEKKEEKEEKDKNYHHVERSFGSFQRTIALPSEVDESKTEASFKNGVLTIKLPKTKEAQQNLKKIAIKQG